MWIVCIPLKTRHLQRLTTCITGVYTHQMRNRKTQKKGKNTIVTSFRILRHQQESLKNLPPSISASVVVRTLLQEYLSGNLPQIHSLVIAESMRTQEAIVNSKF